MIVKSEKFMGLLALFSAVEFDLSPACFNDHLYLPLWPDLYAVTGTFNSISEMLVVKTISMEFIIDNPTPNKSAVIKTGQGILSSRLDFYTLEFYWPRRVE